MSRKLLVVKSVAMAAALAAGVSGIARADYGSMPQGQFEPEVQASPSAEPAQPLVFNPAGLTWRQSNPNGLSVNQMQSLWGSWAGQYKLSQPAPAALAEDTTFSPEHAYALSESELQAKASDAPAWQIPKQPSMSVLAANNEATPGLRAGS